jgi:hypothetical protein
MEATPMRERPVAENDPGKGLLELNDRFFQVLLDKTVNEPYPSTLMLDMIEESLTPPMRQVYITSLLDRIERDEFPSPPR